MRHKVHGGEGGIVALPANTAESDDDASFSNTEKTGKFPLHLRKLRKSFGESDW